MLTIIFLRVKRFLWLFYAGSNELKGAIEADLGVASKQVAISIVLWGIMWGIISIIYNISRPFRDIMARLLIVIYSSNGSVVSLQIIHRQRAMGWCKKMSPPGLIQYQDSLSRYRDSQL